MTRIFLTLQGLFFLGFGIAAFIDPISLVENFGMMAEGRHAVYELRGVYGGVCIGGGLLVLTGAFKSDIARPALYFLLAYTGGYTLARLIGLAFDGLPEPYFWLFTGYEAITALLAFLLIGKNSSA